MEPIKVKVDGLLVREKDREWIARLPKMENDVRRKFISLWRKLLAVCFIVGILEGMALLYLLQEWMIL